MKTSNAVHTVEVWFATGYDYQSVARRADVDAARREAREYWSDSRGIRIVMADGTVEQVKEEATR